ncbi:MAG: hypothetical protein L0G99_05630 [Propionibacteriales bacterium]|nr:hypothetical protein [Propionibacteriales bacterium]
MRQLTRTEEELITLMITSAPDTGDAVHSAERRRAWLTQVPHTRAGARCGCGTCPTIELIDLNGDAPGMGIERIVLSAGSPGALLLLFIDDDQLSSLELAPLEDGPAMDFPEVAEVRL